jgi:hypothetical protein
VPVLVVVLTLTAIVNTVDSEWGRFALATVIAMPGIAAMVKYR